MGCPCWRLDASGHEDRGCGDRLPCCISSRFDCPGGLEFLGRATQVLTRLEELLVKLCYPCGELLDGELCEDTLGEELVGDEACAFGLGQPVLECAELLAEAMVLGASATGLAARLGGSRQRINYHLRELEKSGLVELVEQRQRRGRIERIVRTTARTVVVAPAVIGEPSPQAQDRFAVDTLLAATARTFGAVAEMREAAQAAGQRLVTFTIEADIGFSRPADIERFAAGLADRVADLAAEFDSPQSQRRYHVVVGGHPCPGTGHPSATRTAAIAARQPAGPLPERSTVDD